MPQLGRHSTVTQPPRMIEGRRRAVDTLFHLVSFGLVGAATIILFSVASVSLFTTDKNLLLTGSGDGDAVGRHINGNAALIPASIYSLALDPTNVPAPLPPQGASNSKTAEETEARPGSRLPSPEHDASTTTLEDRDIALIQDSQITKPKSAEVGGSDQATTEPLPEADEGSARGDVSRLTAPSESPEAGDQSYHNPEIDQSQPAKIDQSNIVSNEKVPSHKNQERLVHRQHLSTNTASRDRVQKECGSIIFPALRRHCVASFGIHYR